MDTIKQLVITKPQSDRPQVFYLMGPGGTVDEVLNCCSPDLRSISSNQKLLARGWGRRIQADQRPVAFGLLSVRPFPVRGWQTKKAWQDFISLLKHLVEKGRPSRFQKRHYCWFIRSRFSRFFSHEGPILIKAVGSEKCLNSSATLQHFEHQSWFFEPSRPLMQCSRTTEQQPQ